MVLAKAFAASVHRGDWKRDTWLCRKGEHRLSALQCSGSSSLLRVGTHSLSMTQALSKVPTTTMASKLQCVILNEDKLWQDVCLLMLCVLVFMNLGMLI